MTSGMPGVNAEQMAVLRGSRAIAIVAGLLAVGAGIVLLAWPDRTVVVVARVVGIFLVIGGLSRAIDAIATRKAGTYWGLLLAHGLLDIGIGIAVIVWPSVTVNVLVILLGINLILGGLLSVIVARQVPKDLGGRHMWPGVVSMLAGIVLVIWPGETVTVMAVLLGIYFVLFGLLLLVTGYQLGKVERSLPSGGATA